MIDYEAVKKHFADKLAADFAGQGRFESAFYHTIKMVHDTTREQTLAESAGRVASLQSCYDTLLNNAADAHERIAVLQADNRTLRAALVGRIAVNARVREAGRAVVDRWESPLWKDLPHTGEYIAELRAAIIDAHTKEPE